MTPAAPPPAPPIGDRARPAQPLRLVDREPFPPAGSHPLTTLASPLLPARDTAGVPADVWEELDHASAWVCAHWPGDPATTETERRQALRVLCVAARSLDAAGAPAGGSAGALGPGDLPWNVPVQALLKALRERLVAQTLAAGAAAAPAADPVAVLRVVAALERLDGAARTDATRAVVDQLTGATALDLLVEVAHDMRSPLGSILFLVERLRGAAEAGGVEERQLALIYGAAFGLSAMVGDVMELARGGDRLATGEPAPFALPEVIETVCAIARPLAEERRLALVVGHVPRGVRVGHAAAIQRVLLNLVTNALKYTPEGAVTIDLGEPSRTRVAFRISDTGRGIPPQVLANLFQTFRPRATRDFAFSSAGLGLAICQKLVAAMGGTLAVDSAAGRGTRFAFELELPPAPLGV